MDYEMPWRHTPPNNRLQRTALGAAAEPERWRRKYT